jgi:hypothetical protein
MFIVSPSHLDETGRCEGETQELVTQVERLSPDQGQQDAWLSNLLYKLLQVLFARSSAGRVFRGRFLGSVGINSGRGLADWPR